MAASVKQRLLNLSRKTGEDLQSLLTRFTIERFLYRLCKSEHEEKFVLKGAMLFALWTGEMHRPTRDLDLLGYGDSDEKHLKDLFRSLCLISVEEDGLIFFPDTLLVAPIREDQEYGGQRITLVVGLGSARIDLQIDVGFGDTIIPRPESAEYPTLLGMEPPKLRVYPRETVVAEKLEAMVKLGLSNSRMKDFYDLLILARFFSFGGLTLQDAIKATFTRRGTVIPVTPPIALTEEFANDGAKQKQWQAFRKRSGIGKKVGALNEVVVELANFLQPPLKALAETTAFVSIWQPGGPWEIST